MLYFVPGQQQPGKACLDGMYSFNEYNTRVKYLSEIGNPDKLKNTNNLYFVTYRDNKADKYLKDGNDYFKMPRLSPTSEETFFKFESEPFVFNIEFGDESAMADVYALLYAENVDSDKLIVKINGGTAIFEKATEDGLYIFRIDQTFVNAGINKFYIEYEGDVNDDRVLKDASIFFCRDKNDLEMRKLIAICK